jgi:Tfp pilus assembly protein PilX
VRLWNRLRRIRPADDTGSLTLVMLMTLVGSTLSALLLPIALNQLRSTSNEIHRAHALNAAQVGLDVALAAIRAANDGAGAGVRAALPCGPLTGQMGVGSTASYQVTVDYLAVDPQGQSDNWLTANRLPCGAGSGPSSTPAYAALRSQGTDQPAASPSALASRSLRATYMFRTTNQSIPGGLIRAYKTSASIDLCLDAGSGSPASGTNLWMQACSTGSVRQKFAYNPNLTLVLIASKTPSAPLGMCLEAAAPHAVGRNVLFRPCAATTTPAQQWIYNDYANFEGTADGRTADGFCINVRSPNTAGSLVVLGSAASLTCRRAYDNVETFTPEPAVGTGAAGAPARQLVNFNQYARCLEATEQNVNSPYLIDRPCRQAPDPSNVPWEQRWALPALGGAASATGLITTTAPTGLYCMQSPGTTAAGQYVRVAACVPGVTPQNMRWTVFGETGSYPTSYRIQDGYGYCLSPTDPAAAPPDLHPNGVLISKMVVAVCSGSTMQKWNAPPNILQSLPLKDITEK